VPAATAAPGHEPAVSPLRAALYKQHQFNFAAGARVLHAGVLSAQADYCNLRYRVTRRGRRRRDTTARCTLCAMPITAPPAAFYLLRIRPTVPVPGLVAARTHYQQAAVISPTLSYLAFSLRAENNTSAIRFCVAATPSLRFSAFTYRTVQPTHTRWFVPTRIPYSGDVPAAVRTSSRAAQPCAG